MKKHVFWALFFLICFTLGLLHGLRPRGTSITSIIPPKSISVLITDEALFDHSIRLELENKLSVRFSVTVTRNWDAFIVKLIESPSVDLIITPANWIRSLQKQNLLSDITDLTEDLLPQVSPDFIKDSQSGFMFLPLYWIRTALTVPGGGSFLEFLENKNIPNLHLLADEDLILRRIELWRQQGLLEKVLQKKILAAPLDKIGSLEDPQGAQERIGQNPAKSYTEGPSLNALLVWGAGIPKNSTNKDRAVKILKQLIRPEIQEDRLLKSPFNSCLRTISDKTIPLNRRAEWVRDLKLNETILLEDKDADAIKKLRETYKLNIL